MEKNKYNLRNIIVAVIIIAAAVTVMILLIPIENKRIEHDKYGKLAEAAETDPRARTIIDNIEEYPEKVVECYYLELGSGDAEDIESALQFIYDYPAHKGDYYKMSFTEEELNSGTVPALYMDDHRWAYEYIGSNYIKVDGCAAVSITMAGLFLNRDGSIDPVKVSAAAEKIGALNPIGGINSLEMKNVCEELGLKCNEYIFDSDFGGYGAADTDLIKGILDKGNVIIAGMVGETFGGHTVIIRSCADDGTIRINDPGSVNKTNREWRIENLRPEIYYIWEIEAGE